MASPHWLTPHLSWVSGTVTAVLVLLFCVYLPVRGRVNYRRLVAARSAGEPDVLVRYLRRAAIRQIVSSVVVVALVAFSGGLSRADLGLRSPTGPHASYWSTYTLVLIAVVAVTGLLLRRRALSGRSIPGQRLFWALVPVNRRERGLAALVAVGAGVSEELVFRGLFTAALVAVGGISGAAAACLVTIAFGLAHTYQGVPGVLGTALAGGLFSVMYLQTQSLLWPIVLHVVIDLRGLVLVPLSRASTRPVAPRPAAAAASAPQDGPGAAPSPGRTPVSPSEAAPTPPPAPVHRAVPADIPVPDTQRRDRRRAH